MCAPGPVAQNAEMAVCPACEEWYCADDGVTSLASEHVVLCPSCSRAEEAETP